jgi:hypothetical protein
MAKGVSGKNETAQERSVAVAMAMDEISFSKIIVK